MPRPRLNSRSVIVGALNLSNSAIGRVIFAVTRLLLLTPVIFYTRVCAGAHVVRALRTRGVNRSKFQTVMLSMVLGVVVTTGLAATLVQPANAVASNTLNFQARLEGLDGAIAPDGNYNVEFKLYSATTGGTALWTEDHLNSASNGLRLVNGYLTVELGSVTAFPSTIPWDQSLYVTMNIGGTGAGAPSYDGEMNPRLKLTAVPYAFQAKYAEQLRVTNGSNVASLGFVAPTQIDSILLPDASGTVCLERDYSGCGFASASGSTGYIQNSTTLQGTANFNIQSKSATDPTAVIQAFTGGQTADLLTLRNDAGTASLGGFNSSGRLYYQSGSFVGTLVQDTLTTNNVNYHLPNASTLNQTLCTYEAGNCAGSGSGITGSGVTNYIARFNSNNTITASSLLFDNNSFVGIGTVAAGNGLLSVVAQNATQTGVFISGASSATAAVAVVRATTGQTGDLLQFQNATNTPLTVIAANGSISTSAPATIGSTSSLSGVTGQLNVLAAGGAGIGQIIRAGTAQTADLLDLQNSSGSVTSGFNSNGQLFYNSGSFVGTVVQDSLTTNNVNYHLPNSPTANQTLCTYEAGNCAGSGSGITGSGTAGYVARFNTNNTINASSLIYDNAGIIGVGTTTGLGVLNVQGTSGSQTSLYALGAPSASVPVTIIRGGASPATTADLLDLQVDGGANVVSFDRSGNVVANGSVSAGNGLTVVSGGANIAGTTVITGTTNINTTGLAATNIGTSGGSFSLASSGLNVSAAGALSGITTLVASGALSAATTGNTINGLIINGGALSGITGYTQTVGNFDASASTGTFNTSTGQVNLNGATNVTGNGTFTTGTGTVKLGSLGTGLVQSALDGTLTSGAVDRNSSAFFSNSLNVTNGGTGASTFTANGLLFGNGTGAVQATAAAANSVLITSGTNVPSLSQTLPLLVQGNITTVGALTSGSIASGFGAIATANAISTTAAITGNTVNAAGTGAALQLNGTDINTAGTLSNVAYLNQANTFTGVANTFTGTVAVQGSGGLTLGTPTTAGKIALTDGAGHSLTFTTGALTANVVLSLPNGATGTTDVLCLKNLANCGTTGAVLGSGTQNYIAKFDTASNHIGNSSIYDNGSFVGINNSTNSSGLFGIIGASPSQSGFFVQAAASSTTSAVVIKGGATPASGGDLLQLLDSTGAVLARVDSTGTVTLASLKNGGSGGIITSNGTGILSSGALDRNSLSYFTGTLTVASGGTGVATIPSGGLIYGNGTGSVGTTTGTAGQLVFTNGTTPTFTSLGGDLTASTTTIGQVSVSKLQGNTLTIGASGNTLTNGQYLRYNGAAFVNSGVQASDITGTLFSVHGSSLGNVDQTVSAGQTLNFVAGASNNLTVAGSNSSNLNFDIVNNPTFTGGVTSSSNTTGFSLTGAPTPGTGATALLQVGSALSSGNSSTNGGTYIGINEPATGPGSAADFLNFQANGINKFKVTNSGNLTLGGTLTISGLGSGLLQTNASGAVSSGVVDRNNASYFNTALNVGNGGTGLTTLTSGGVLYAGSTSSISQAAGTAGQVLIAGIGGVPNFANISGDISLSTSGAATINSLQTNPLVISAPTSGQFLRYDGTKFANSAIQASDIPNLSSSYISNATSNQTGANFNITARAATVAAKIQGASGQDIIDFYANASAITPVASIDAGGNLTALNGSFAGSLSSGTASSAGSIILTNGVGQTATIRTGAIAGSTVLSLPTNVGTSDTFCLVSLANCTSSTSAAGSTNYIAKFTSSTALGAQTSGASLYDDSTFFGVGTTTNNGLVSVQGTSTTQTSLFVTAVASATTPVAIIKGGLTPGSGADLLQLQNGAGSTIAKIDQNGNVLGASFDTATAAILNIGQTNATGIALDKNTVVTGSFKAGSATQFQVDTAGNSSTSGSTTTVGLTNSGSTLNSAIALGNFATGGSIGSAATTVDAATTINIAQTTTGQILSLASPTVTTAGRIVYINAISTADVTVNGQYISAGQGAAFEWNGSAWTILNNAKAGTGLTQNGSIINSTAPTSVSNDTNIQGSIASNVLTLSFAGTLSAARGGTGLSSYTTNGILYASNSTTLSQATGTSGQVLLANGSGVPSFTSLSGDVVINGTGATTLNKLQGNTLTITTPTSGQYLRYNGSAFVNAAITASDVSGTLFTVHGTSAGNIDQTVSSGQTLNFVAGASSNLTVTGSNSRNLTFDIVSNPSFAGKVTAVGIDAGSGAISGTGGATLSGAININASGTGATNIGNATSGALNILSGANSAISTGAFNLGITSSNFNVAAASGAVTAGTYNGQTISSAANFTGTLAIAGANALTLGTTGANTGAIVFRGSTAASGSLTLIGPASPNTGNFSLTIPSVTSNESVCVSNAACAGYAQASSLSGYVQLQSTTPGTAQVGNLNINGTAIVESLQAGNTGITSTGPVKAASVQITGLGAGLVKSDATGNLSSSIIDRNSSTYFNSTLSVTNGGTGLTSLTTNSILYATGATTFGQVTGTSGQLLLANASGVPTFTSLTGDLGINGLGVTSINKLQGNTLIITGPTSGQYLRYNGSAFVNSAIASADVSGTLFTVHGNGVGNVDQSVSSGQTLSLLAGASNNLTVAGSNTRNVTFDIIQNPTFTGTVTSSSNTTGLSLTGTPVAGIGATSLFQLGGTISGGNASANGGTYVGINEPTTGAGSAADFLNFQVAGTSKLTVDNTGLINTAGGLSVGGSTVITSGRVAQNLAGVVSSGTIQFSSITNTGNTAGLIVGSGNGTLSSTTLDRNNAAYFNTTLTTANGGTGLTSYTANGVLFASTTAAISQTTGTAGQILQAGAGGVPGFVSASGDLTIATGGAFTIANNAITSAKILDGTIVNADLAVGSFTNITGVGALTTGSIAAGFGTISTTNTITGTTLNGTTGINTGAGAGTLRLDASGNLSNIGTIAATGAVTAGTYNGQTISSAASLTGTLAVAGALTGASTIQGTQLISTVATGTAPLVVSSTTLVTNLNADLLDGQHASAFASASGSTNYIQNTTTQQAASNFNISGAGVIGTTLAVASNATVGGTLAVTGAVTGGTYNGQTISSAANFTGTLAVAGATTLSSTLAVTGTSTFTGALTANGGISTTSIAASGNISQTPGSTISAGTGYKINGAAATAGTFLRGDGTNFVASTIQAGDIPAGSANYIQNTTTQQAASNFNISGAGVIGTTLTVTGATTLSSTLAVTGAVTGGTYNGQTISSAANFTGTLAVAGATTLSSTLAVTGTSTFTGALTANGGISTTTLNATTGINTGAGAGTQRLDASGNLVNIGNLTFGAAYPYVNASTYINIPGGAYFSSGTVYTEAAIQARGGIHNDNGAALTLSGGTSGYTYVNGSLGVGTAAPTQKLDVQGGNINTSGSYLVGGSTANGQLRSNTTGTLNLLVGSTTLNIDNNAGNTNLLAIANSGAVNVAVGPLQTGGTTRLDASGNLSNIGTIAASGAVTAGTYNGQTISSAANFTGTLAVAGATTLSSTLIVQGAGNSSFIGNLGVGTAAPTQKLEVNGNVRLDQIAAPAAPTVAINATAGNLTGNYSYRISFVTASGETETGAASATVSPSAQQINLSAIPISPDARVTARKLYRTTSYGSNLLMKLVTTIADNTTTTYTDNLADASLGVAESQINTTGGILYNGTARALVVDNATTAVGLGALSVNTGHLNTALGNIALQNNTTGYNNTATGAEALYSNTTGNSNTASGVDTLFYNTSGTANTAAGKTALFSNTTGNFNTASGNEALYFNISGGSNTASGLESLYHNTSGSQNVASGMNALFSNTSGNNNTAAGYSAGLSYNSANANTTGSYNSFFGYDSGPGTATQLQNATAIGAYSAVSQNDSLALGCVNGVNGCTATTNIGVGTAAPFTQFVVSGKVPTGAAGSVATGTAPSTIKVQGRYAYVTNQTTNTLQIFDVSNPAAPVSKGSVATGTVPQSMNVQGRYAYVLNAGSTNTLQIFDVSNPAAPVSVGSVATASNPAAVIVQGRYAYVPSYNSSILQIFDVSYPSTPLLVGSVATGANPYDIFVQGRYAYIPNNGANTLQIFDVSNPAAPVSVGSVAAGTQPAGVIVQGRYAYVVNLGSSTLQIFDVSNPAAPVSVGSVPTGASPQNLNVQGRYAYIPNYGSNTFQIFDVSNPAAPVSVGSVATGTQPIMSVVQGRYAYVANFGSNTLQTFDLGGAYIQSLQVGSLETGSIATSGDATVGGNATVLGGVTANSLNVFGGSNVGTLNVTNGPLHVATAGPLGSAQGAYIEWNRLNGDGYTDFINNRGGGPGGFHFGNTLDGSTVVQLASLDANGNLVIKGNYTANGTPDLAETIPAASDVTAADVVIADPTNTERVIKSTQPYQTAAVGVISDGTSSFTIAAHGNGVNAPGYKPLVLAGRVPVKISPEGGSVSPGDYLTTSSTPGYAMKATHAGATIGKALGFYDVSTGNSTVLALVNVSYYDPNSGDNIQAKNVSTTTLQASGDAVIGGSATIGSNLNVAGATTLSSLMVTGSADIAGNLGITGNLTVKGSATIAGNLGVTGNLSVTGLTSVADILVGGRLISRGNAPQLIIGEAAGTSTTQQVSPNVSVEGTDTAGTMTITSGQTVSKTGVLAEVNFSKQYDVGTTFKVALTPTNEHALDLRVYVQKTTTGFQLMTRDMAATGTAYSFDYIVVGAQQVVGK